MDKRGRYLLKRYYSWPFFAGIVFAVAVPVTMLLYGWKTGLAVLAAAALYYLVALILFLIFRSRIEKKLVDFGQLFSEAEKRMLKDVTVPFAFSNGDGQILWCNPAFSNAFLAGKTNGLLSGVFPEADSIRFADEELTHVTNGDRNFAMEIARAPENLIAEFSDLTSKEETELYLLYLTDETDLLYFKRTLAAERVVMALVYFDNYEEVMSSIEYVRRSLLSALLERKLNKHFSELNAVIRKLEKDRFFVVMNQESLWQLENEKFPLLEDIKTVSIGNDMAVTLSIGVGTGGESYEKNYEFARAAIDMALGRGGDQAVIKSKSEIRYFGGKTKGTERNTRVKARTKAHALRELIEAKDKVVIMGHPISDMDCLGAAVAVYRAAKFSGKKASIVIGDVSSSVFPIVQSFRDSEEYEEDMFLTPEEAKSVVGKDTLLVVVDTNRPSYTVCPELLSMTSSIVVIDHHRQGRETIESALLSYVEPYASSASEMAAEIAQYYDENIKFRAQEADAVFAGIVMDTNNFEDKAGVRTFEAAAYLRRCGADVTRVRKFFRDSIEDYKLRAETVQSAEVFKDGYIIGICPQSGANPNQTVVAAQAANELLEIRGIKASFVLTEYEGRVFLSARSIDEVNVQVMMEKLGGGGHLSVAGAQFEGITVEEAVERLKAVIEEESV